MNVCSACPKQSCRSRCGIKPLQTSLQRTQRHLNIQLSSKTLKTSGSHFPKQTCTSKPTRTTAPRYHSLFGCLSSLKWNFKLPSPDFTQAPALTGSRGKWDELQRSQWLYSDLQASGMAFTSAISWLKESQNSQDKVSRWFTIPIQSRFSPRLFPAAIIYVRGDNHYPYVHVARIFPFSHLYYKEYTSQL